ncbi:protein bcn92-like [Artemia franciscana]|uniref:protein bcn92-like n=1 Tax=Artemia franciscana TaxID=6661 RepID=UPI0032DB9E8B
MSNSFRKKIMLYKNLLREAHKFDSYNYREYFQRKIRDSFRESKSLQDEAEIRKRYQYGIEMLTVLRRQVLVGNLYGSPKIVVEK